MLLFNACSTNPPPSSQNPVAQTQQGIRVGLSIYDSNHPTEQLSSAINMQITVMSPDFSQPLKSPVTIHGRVSGLFFSEGTFPVVLTDASGKELARTVAHADDEWMTENQVAFTAQLTFKRPLKPLKANLVFWKDNPSGLPANDKSQSFEVTLQ